LEEVIVKKTEETKEKETSWSGFAKNTSVEARDWATLF